jgi:hypothetical protein
MKYSRMVMFSLKTPPARNFFNLFQVCRRQKGSAAVFSEGLAAKFTGACSPAGNFFVFRDGIHLFGGSLAADIGTFRFMPRNAPSEFRAKI